MSSKLKRKNQRKDTQKMKIQKRLSLQPASEIEKRFTNSFWKLAGSKNKETVWDDIINIMAITLSNYVETDRKRRALREDEYEKTIKKYDYETASELFAIVMEAIALNPNQDFLGKMYMQLNIGKNRRYYGFSPYDVCQVLAALTMNLDEIKNESSSKGKIVITVPECDAGGTMIAAHQYLKENGINPN